MNKWSLLVLLLVISTSSFLFSQDSHNDVLNYLANKRYGDSTCVSLYIDDLNVDLSSELSEELTLSFLNTVNSMEHFHLVKQMILKEEGRIIDYSDGNPTHYVLICQLNHIAYLKNNSASPFTIEGTLRCIDIVTGETLLIESFHAIFPRKLPGNYKSRRVDIKKLRPFNYVIKKILYKSFQGTDWVRKVALVGKKKIESVYLDLKLHNQNRKPRKLNAFIISDELIVDKRKVYLFKKVGQLEKPFIDKSNREWVGYHIKKGKDEIFQLMENNTKIYVSPNNLGR